MRHSVAHSLKPDSAAALAEVLDAALRGLDGAAPTLGLLLLTGHHAGAAETFAAEISKRIAPGVLLGGTAESLISGSSEIERRPALVLWLASWPGADVRPRHLTFEGEDENGTFLGLPDPMPDPGRPHTLFLIPDPFTFPCDLLLKRLGGERPGCLTFGGMASGGWNPGANRLIVGPEVYDHGAAAAVVSGGVRIETVVSQGCRPIGKPFIITKSEGNVLQTLGGKPALQRLQEVFEALPPEDQQIARRALHVGQAIDEMKDEFGRGDFLIRNVMGIDPKSGAVVIGDAIRPGRTVQFQVRDAASAKEDLRFLMKSRREKGLLPPGSGALLVSCNGRGSRLFGEPDCDAGAVRDALGDVPLAGFFAAGEIGPVGGKNFLHGFTASLAIFTPTQDA